MTAKPNFVFKIGEDRLRVPKEIRQVTVQFGEAPFTRMLFKRFGAWRLLLRGTVLAPTEFAGRSIVGSYTVPSDGRLGSGSRLGIDARTVSGGTLAEGDMADLQRVFAHKRVVVELRRVEKDHRSQPVEPYAVIDHIIRVDVGSRKRGAGSG